MKKQRRNLTKGEILVVLSLVTIVIASLLIRIEF